MTVAIVVISVVAFMSTGLAIFLLFRLLKSEGSHQGQGGAFGMEVGEIRHGMDRVNQAIQSLSVDRARPNLR